MIERIKVFISRYVLLKNMAEPLLNLRATMRARRGGGYGQYGEDVYIMRIMNELFNIPPKQVTYLDIGAFHYMRSSNTYLFYKRGACGYLVEANPILCKNLRRKRSRDTVFNVAVTNKMSKADASFYVCSLPTRSTIDPNVAHELEKKGYRINEVVRVKVKTINEILEQIGTCPDLLSIDAEGLDEQVLRSLDYDKHRVKVIVAENNELSMTEFLKDKGYFLARKTRANVIFALDRENESESS